MPPTFGLGCSEGLVSLEGPCPSYPGLVSCKPGAQSSKRCIPAPQTASSSSQWLAVSSFYLCTLSDWSFLLTKKLRLLGCAFLSIRLDLVQWPDPQPLNCSSWLTPKHVCLVRCECFPSLCVAQWVTARRGEGVGTRMWNSRLSPAGRSRCPLPRVDGGSSW